ncbi:MAG: hypothetical protein LLG04_03235 [Parachlamydia sp.]|nr:hypothetical protein [Parachlamydia sp.]
MEEFAGLAPINFFQLEIECPKVESGFPKINAKNKGRYILPNTSELCAEWPFAEVAMGWNGEGLELFIAIDQAVHRVSYPNVTQGDSVELFFDTRDVKTSGFNTRFCHHFFFLPEAVEGNQAGEITRFRGEETHELCDPKELSIKASLKSAGYTLQIFIPRSCLYGYDPEQFQRLGFSYRINRSSGPSQHFSVISDEYTIEQQPSLWSSVRLV